MSAPERELLRRVDRALDGRRADWAVDHVTVGDRLVAVELAGDAGRAIGVAHGPRRAFGGTPPQEAAELSRWAYEPPAGDPAAASLGIATLNARSDGAINWRPGDPMAALDPDVDTVATVGLFRAAFRRFADVEVRVIEREAVGELDPPPGVTVSVHRPAEAAAAIEGADVLFVTGSSLLYGGTVRYLELAAGVPTVVLIGATASFHPGPAFEAGVDVVAGARVTDPDRVRSGIEAGECATDLHGLGLEKVYLAADGGHEGLRLD